jgi:hypothetical protein
MLPLPQLNKRYVSKHLWGNTVTTLRCVKFEILTALLINSNLLRCDMVFFTLKMKGARSFETSVIVYLLKLLCVPKDLDFLKIWLHTDLLLFVGSWKVLLYSTFSVAGSKVTSFSRSIRQGIPIRVCSSIAVHHCVNVIMPACNRNPRLPSAGLK